MWPTMCQRGIPTSARWEADKSLVTSVTFADASWSRDSPTARQPNRDKIATSVAGKNLVTGRSSISVTLRPAASAATASRERTEANPSVNSVSRSLPLPGAGICTAIESLDPDQRRQPPGRRVPAMTEKFRVLHRAARIDVDRRDPQLL